MDHSPPLKNKAPGLVAWSGVGTTLINGDQVASVLFYDKGDLRGRIKIAACHGLAALFGIAIFLVMLVVLDEAIDHNLGGAALTVGLSLEELPSSRGIQARG